MLFYYLQKHPLLAIVPLVGKMVEAFVTKVRGVLLGFVEVGDVREVGFVPEAAQALLFGGVVLVGDLIVHIMLINAGVGVGGLGTRTVTTVVVVISGFVGIGELILTNVIVGLFLP